MALFDNEQKYYYFKLHFGKPYEIKVSSIHINTIINLIYVEMTDEQREFYLANPTATVQEVWDCELAPPYVPPTPDIQEYAETRIKELKDACYGSINITSLEFAIASDKLDNITADCYYSLIEARQIVSDFRTQSKKAMSVYDTYKTKMETATTVEDIDSFYDQAISEL